MSKGFFDRNQNSMSYISEKINLLLEEDFKYRNEDGKLVDRLEGVSKNERRLILVEARLLVDLISNIKERVDELDLMLSHDTSPESYFPEMIRLRNEFNDIIE